MSVAAAAITAGAGLVGTGISQARNKKQHEYNKELAMYQNNMNVHNWNMQNTYNSPIEQRKRLEEAGLNPALAYGGAGNTGNAAPIHEYKQAGVDFNQSIMATSQLAGLAKTLADVRLTRAQAEEQEEKNPYAGATAEAYLNNMISDTKVKDSEVKKKLQEIEKMRVDMNATNKTIEQMNADIALKIAQAATEKERKKLTKFQQWLTLAQSSLVNSQERTEHYNRAQKAAQTWLYGAQYVGVNADNWLKQWKNEYVQKYGMDPDAKGLNFFAQLVTASAEGKLDLVNLAGDIVGEGLGIGEGKKGGLLKFGEKFLRGAKHIYDDVNKKWTEATGASGPGDWLNKNFSKGYNHDLYGMPYWKKAYLKYKNNKNFKK